MAIMKIDEALKITEFFYSKKMTIDLILISIVNTILFTTVSIFLSRTLGISPFSSYSKKSSPKFVVKIGTPSFVGEIEIIISSGCVNASDDGEDVDENDEDDEDDQDDEDDEDAK